MDELLEIERKLTQAAGRARARAGETRHGIAQHRLITAAKLLEGSARDIMRALANVRQAEAYVADPGDEV